MNELKIFNSEEFGEIRTTVIQGSPWFCLADLCRSLEIKNPADMKKRLIQKGIAIIDTLTPGGTQQLLYVSESNLYKTIFQSRKESAERFTEWVTGEVLPSIRKNGAYVSMTTSDQIKLLAQGNIEIEKKVNMVNERVDSLEQNMPLYGCEIDEIKNHVNRKGVKVLGGKESEAYQDASIRGSVYSDIYRQLKREYGAVSSYKSIKRKYMADLHDFIDCYDPPTVLAEQIQNANSQMSFGRKT